MPVLLDQHRDPRWCPSRIPNRRLDTAARTRLGRARSAAPNLLPQQDQRTQRYGVPPLRNADIPRQRRRPERPTANERRVNPRPKACRRMRPSARARAAGRRPAAQQQKIRWDCKSDPSNIAASRVYRGRLQTSASHIRDDPRFYQRERRLAGTVSQTRGPDWLMSVRHGVDHEMAHPQAFVAGGVHAGNR